MQKKYYRHAAGFPTLIRFPESLPLLYARPRLALVRLDRVQHDLGRVLGIVALVPLAPVVAHSIGEDGASLVEGRRRDASSHVRVSLEPVFGVLVPEVEGAVAAGRAEGPVLRVEGDVIDRVDIGDVPRGRVSVAFEGEVGAGKGLALLNFVPFGKIICLTSSPCRRHIGWRTALQCYQWQSLPSP